MRPSRHWLTVGVCAVVAVVGMLLFRIALDRPVTSVRVEGTLSVEERSAVQTVLTHRLQTPLLSLDLDAVVGDVLALSWPQSVTARRHWPSTLVIRVHKQQIVAGWSGAKYLTSNGKVVSLAEPRSGLPMLRCRRAQPDQALRVYQRLAQVAKHHRSQLVALTESELGQWQVRLRDNIVVTLGAAPKPLQLAQRLERYFSVRNDLPTARVKALRTADARYANGVALRFDSNDSSLLAHSPIGAAVQPSLNSSPTE